jgi:hypothetical protein
MASNLPDRDVLIDLQRAAKRRWQGAPAPQSAGLFARAAREIEQLRAYADALNERCISDAAAGPLDVTVRPRPGLYVCSRTSAYGERPCDEAFEISLVNTDTRACNDPKKIPANAGTDGDWYERGTNHRVEGGMIRRDLGTKTEWAVEILDILQFVQDYGPCILSVDVDGINIIEIYDDYRE